MQDGLDLSAVGAKPLSKLSMCVKPRYHFAALHQTFYERIPYRYSTSIPVLLVSAQSSGCLWFSEYHSPRLKTTITPLIKFLSF